jgi:type IV pilus assembly protein PilW
MAHYWGLTSRTHAVLGRARGTEPHAGLGSAACGANWAVDLEAAVGTDDGYGFACPGFAPVATQSDTLVVRRATLDPVTAPLDAGGVYVQSTRGGTPAAQLFTGASGVPAGFDPSTSATHRLVVNGYYVSRRSSLGTDVPSLRRKTLRANGTIGDEEVLPYIEDLQVKYGVDTSPRGTRERGAVNRYVDADDPIFDASSPAYLPDAAVLAVRVWLRVRADEAETGYADPKRFVYADRDFGTFGDGFRRLVVTKTIYLRNARPAV